MLNSINFTYCRHSCVQWPWLPITGREFWRISDVLDDYWPYFHCACAETAISELPMKNLTLPFTAATSIFYNRGGKNSSIRIHFRYILAIF